MSFDEYLESEIPGYKSLLTEEEIGSLKKDYEQKDFYEKAANTCFNMQFSSKANIDYANDYEKNNARAWEYRNRLKQEIASLQTRLGIVKETNTEENNLGR